jgi:AcrR family transcriptional regulator
VDQAQSVNDAEERFPRRARRARETRRRLTDAATVLFVDPGYLATTMQAIARAADVAPQTVYAVFGTKRALLAAAIDNAIAGDDEPVPVNDRPWMQPVWQAQDAVGTLHAYAAAVRLIQARSAGLFRALDAAAPTEAALAELATESARRRRLGASGVIHAAVERGPLADGLGIEDAVDLVWLYNGHDVYLHLTNRCGWSDDAYERWLGATLVSQVLRCQPLA